MTKLNRTNKPKEGIPNHFHLPQIEKFNLDNGLEVHLIENKKLPIITLNLVVPAGSRFDPYGNEGISYLTALTLDEGAGNYDALQLANEIDKLGSSIEISAGADHIFIKLTSLQENFERTLELFSLILKEPQFNEESFQREKKKQVTKISQVFDNPDYIAANAYQKNIFAGTGYEKPILGYSSSVQNINLTSVKDFYSKTFRSPETKLMIVGSSNKKYVSQLLNNYLGDFIFNSNTHFTEYDFPTSNPELFFINKEEAAQSEIVAGHLIKDRTDNQFFAAKIANSILGGQFTSRINLNLREDKGYTYGANSSLSYNKQTGYFTVSTSVQSEFTLQSLREIKKELDLIRENVTGEEISFAKSSLVKQFPSNFETYTQLLQRLNTKVIFDLSDDYYDEFIQNIWDVTKEEILEAAQDYFLPNKICYFVVGNKELIWDEVNKFGDRPPVELDKFGNLLQ